MQDLDIFTIREVVEILLHQTFIAALWLDVS